MLLMKSVTESHVTSLAACSLFHCLALTELPHWVCPPPQSAAAVQVWLTGLHPDWLPERERESRAEERRDHSLHNINNLIPNISDCAEDDVTLYF